jgi:hypothetical protein
VNGSATSPPTDGNGTLLLTYWAPGVIQTKSPSVTVTADETCTPQGEFLKQFANSLLTSVRGEGTLYRFAREIGKYSTAAEHNTFTARSR